MARDKSQGAIRNGTMPVKKFEAEKHPDDRGSLKPGPGRESFKMCAFWKQEINAFEQFTMRYVQRGNTVIKRFRDERSKMETEGMRRMNLLWATTCIMKPAIYSKCPDPTVDRKFMDKDPIGRLSSVILERATRSQLEHGFHTAMNRAVYDRLLPGRGVVWFRYEPEYGTDEDNDTAVSLPAQASNSLEDSLVKIAKDTGDDKMLEEIDSPEEEELESTGDVLASEKIVTDYIDWRDFYIFPAKARTWEEVQAIGKRVFVSKAEAMERFGEDIGEDMRPDTTPDSSNNVRNQQSDTTIFRDINERSIVVFEIWNKSDRKVYWLSTGYEYICDVRKDPYKLKKFFPVPMPLCSTITNDSLTPVPDYYEWQDQAIQIDELTQRIALLTRACKVAGAYNAANKQLSRIFEETTENQLIPVDQWAMFAQSGGLKGALDFVPIDQIQSCIETLMKVRQQAMQDLDQITGISDVVRGTTDSRETLGGIRLKNNNAGTRLSESQTEVQRFARDGIQIIAELIANHFEDETLVECSGILYDEEMQPDAVLREFEPVMPGFGQSPKPQGGMPGQPPVPGQPHPSPTNVPPVAVAGQASQPPQPEQGSNVIPFPGQPQMPDPEVLIMDKLTKAIKLIRSDITRNYRISIETDSTIYGDKVQERQDASDFVEAIGGFMGNFEKLGATIPEAMPLLARTLEWAARKYRIGRDLEAEINSFVSRMEKKAKMLIENPQPSIDQQKLDAQKQKDQQDTQTKLQLAQMDSQRQEQDDMRQAQIQQQNDERDAQKQAAEDQREAQLQQQKAQLEQQKMAMEMEKAKMDMQIAVLEHKLKMEQLQAKTHADTQKANMDMHMQQQDHQLEQTKMVDEHNMQRESHEIQKEQMHDQHSMAKETHKQGMQANKQKADLQAQSHKQKQQQMKVKPQNKGKK